MRFIFLILFLQFSIGLFAQTVSPDIKTIHVNDFTEIPVKHVVQLNETLEDISKAYSVTIEEIKKWNNMTGNEIETGQSIIVGYKKTESDKLIPPAEIINPSSTVVTTPAREYIILPLNGTIQLDGIPNEDAWKNANVADKFIQRDPVEGAAVSQQTEVKMLYSSSAIYIAAVMHDTHPDSILHQLGNRDESNSLNSDGFRFGLDPYNTRQAGYVFEVSASGVQSESFNDDFTFDAVWESKINRDNNGWTVEMKIPYSAIRFPADNEQKWAIQFARTIRRNREYDQWTLTPKNQQNGMLFWGTMTGIKNVDPPLRLSLTPYVSLYTEQAGSKDENGNNIYENSYSYSGGADLKYGINESFTIDLTLLPDFSQVQSDNKVKNISAYEVYYNEQRPFFKEGTQLFSKGDLLYTRRIGKTPEGFYSVENSLQEGETIDKNPDKAKLLNAVKLSGRTKKGFGIGLLNAVTDNTYATINQKDGGKREILTDPLSNYNLIIFDQQLKNNSSVSLVNTNVSRVGQNRDANVTLAQGRFENASHQYAVTGDYSESHIFEWMNGENGTAKKEHIRGQKYNASVDKISGSSWYGISYGQINKNYDKNDMGYQYTNDISEANVYYQYSKFNPFWKRFRQGNVTVFANRTGRVSSNNQLQSLRLGGNFFLLFLNNWSIYAEFGFNPVKGRDYNEPRIENKFFNSPKVYNSYTYFSTDYNKPLAFDYGGYYNFAPEVDYHGYGFFVIPMIRLSDKFNIKFNLDYNQNNNDLGFAYLNSGEDTSYFGRRNIITITNSFTSRYIFKNDMSLSLTARHYWSKGNYESFFRLEDSGDLTPIFVTNENIHNSDFNSNYLTVDLVYKWQFAPGSSFLITYKNLVESDTQENITGYFTNLKNTFKEPQTNSISLKVLYFLDYEYLKKK